MGSGKSAVGRRAAKAAGMEFIDLDDILASQESISNTFEKHGEGYFRQREKESLASLLTTFKEGIIATGGGTPLDTDNRALLKSKCTVVWLKSSLDIILGRIKKESRPLLSGKSYAEIAELFEKREAIYRETADIIIEKDEKSLEETVECVRKILCP